MMISHTLPPPQDFARAFQHPELGRVTVGTHIGLHA